MKRGLSDGVRIQATVTGAIGRVVISNQDEKQERCRLRGEC
jgi:hypothetical protein